MSLFFGYSTMQYIYIFQKLLACVKDLSTPDISNLLNYPPFDNITIKQAMSNFVANRPIENRLKDIDLALALVVEMRGEWWGGRRREWWGGRRG